MEIMTLKTTREVSRKKKKKKMKKLTKLWWAKLQHFLIKVQLVPCLLCVGNSMKAPGAFSGL